MTIFSNGNPSMADIQSAQNSERNLRRQLAKNHWYAAAKRWNLAGTALAIAFALASPLVLLYWPSWGSTLGAVAGAWIFASRLLLEPWKLKLQTKGAAAQELFDCDVLGLAWNPTLASEPSLEEIRNAGRGVADSGKVDKHRNWYPSGVSMVWPASVITCQRSNAVWARMQHYSYGLFLIVAAGSWAVIGIGVAVVHGASLAEYLTTIALPSLPAMLDATELSRKHLSASDKRKKLEDECDRLMSEPSKVTHVELREVQDELFLLRRDAPLVAGWFYRTVKKSYEENMKFAAEEQAKRSS